jgi:hypothetical protein
MDAGEMNEEARERVERWVWLRWKSAEVELQRAYRAVEEEERTGA